VRNEFQEFPVYEHWCTASKPWQSSLRRFLFVPNIRSRVEIIVFPKFSFGYLTLQVPNEFFVNCCKRSVTSNRIVWKYQWNIMFGYHNKWFWCVVAHVKTWHVWRKQWKKFFTEKNCCKKRSAIREFTTWFIHKLQCETFS